MEAVGYAHLIHQLELAAVPMLRPAMVLPVTRLKLIGTTLAVPAAITPAKNELLAHVLFALKHEGINLAVLAQALPRIPAADFEHAHLASPNGVFIRKACYLREAFTGERLNQTVKVTGPYRPLFDPQRYITRTGERNTKWRIDFNGLGDLTYCATVERTAEIQSLLDHDILTKAQAFIAALPPIMMDRALNWAYMHETKDSFAIERESPSEDKSRRFIQLLRQAHQRQPLTEDYLVALQNATVSNPFDLAAAFRHEQNYLSDGTPGAAGVTFLPPPADLCRELMESLMSFANDAPTQVDPLVAAGITSFGFVLLHPFMDGNGRLSRFLIHQALCRAGALDNGLLLPMSVAMKSQELRYLEALQSFSRPVRDLWEVRWIDFGQYGFEFKGHEAVYRYWDATPCVAFTLEMARVALEVELQKEADFLASYDAVYRAVDDLYDVRGSDLATLVMMCLTNDGIVSKNRRKQYQYTVPVEVFDFIEQQSQTILAAQRAEAKQE